MPDLPAQSLAERRAIQRKAERPTPGERAFIDGESYELVVDGQRCDKAFEDAEAARREEAWKTERGQLTETMRAQRKQRSLVERLTEALFRMERLTNLSARPISSPGRSSDEDPGGRRPPGEDDFLIDAARRRVANAIEDLEHLLDEEEGIAAPRNQKRATAEEKDRELLTRYAGVLAAKVAADRPDLGSQAAIYRKRKRAGLDPLGLDPATRQAPDVASVNAMVRYLNADAKTQVRLELGEAA